MKTNLFFRLTAVAAFLFVSFIASGQGNVPQGLNYQGIARDGIGNPLNNVPITLRFSILSGTMPPYVTEYVETQTATTNQFGLFTVKVGMGTPVTGTFSAIPWRNGNQLLQTEIDQNGGSSYTNLGATQLLSVPYALTSHTSQDAWSLNGNSGTTSTSHFFGNADSVDLLFKTNNQPRMVIHDNGKISFGLTNPIYKYQFRNTSNDQIAMYVEGSNAAYSSLYINALSPTASSCLGFTNQSFLHGAINVSSTGDLMTFKIGGHLYTGMTIGEDGRFDLPIMKAKITRSAVSDTNNVVAIAYGNITSAGVINVQGSTNNFTASKAGTGIYYIDWKVASGINTYFSKAAVSVSATGSSARITSWSSGNGGATLIINVFDAAGVHVDEGFSFVVFKP